MATQQDPKGQKKINEAQQKINEGQKKINGALCQVDWDVIYSIKALLKALKNANVLTDAQLSKVKKVIDEAQTRSEGVAAIDPPGCEPALQKPKETEIKAA
jgi:hypothetical protein